MARTGRSKPSHTIQGDAPPIKTLTVIAAEYANQNTTFIAIEPKTGFRETAVVTGYREL